MAHGEMALITQSLQLLQALENELEEAANEALAAKRRLLSIAEEGVAEVSARLLEKADALARDVIGAAIEEASKQEKEIAEQVEKDLAELRKKIEAAKGKALSLVMERLTAI